MVRMLPALFLLLLAAAAPLPAQQQPAPAASDAYILGPGDVIDVSLAGVADYHAQARVDANGTVQLPYAENVPATGRTALELGRAVAAKLSASGYYVKPQVIVSIASYASRYVTVLGAVASPGLLPVDRAYHVSEILARAGGRRVDGADTLTLRRADGQEMRLPIDDLATGGGAQDPMVAPGDKIYVPAARSFFIYGQVNAPGAYPVRDGMTVRQAIARGGGLTQLGTEKRVKIIRNGEELKGAKLEMPLSPDDVVVVGERYF